MSRVMYWKPIGVFPIVPNSATYAALLIVTSKEFNLPPYTYGVIFDTESGTHEVPLGGKSCRVWTAAISWADDAAGRANTKQSATTATIANPPVRNAVFISDDTLVRASCRVKRLCIRIQDMQMSKRRRMKNLLTRRAGFCAPYPIGGLDNCKITYCVDNSVDMWITDIFFISYICPFLRGMCIF